MATSMIEKISLLLNKAERAATPEEADAYFSKAQQLATRESIDLEKARGLKGSSSDKLTTEIVVMGKKRSFGLHTNVILFNNIAVCNGVRCAVSDDSVYLTVYGYESDIALVKMLYTSLLLQMNSESEKYLARGEYRKETIWRDGYHENGVWKPGGYRPMHGSTARISFKRAFAGRVGERLREARQRGLEESGTGSELVLVGKQGRVDDFFSGQVNTSRTWKGGEGFNYSVDGIRAGHEAANRASLGEPAVGGAGRAEL